MRNKHWNLQKKYFLFSIQAQSKSKRFTSAIFSSCDLPRKLHRFTAIHKSSPVASWDCKCPSDAHFRISPEVVGHVFTSRSMFYEYYEFGHTTRLVYFLFANYIVWKYAYLGGGCLHLWPVSLLHVQLLPLWFVENLAWYMNVRIQQNCLRNCTNSSYENICLVSLISFVSAVNVIFKAVLLHQTGSGH